MTRLFLDRKHLRVCPCARGRCRVASANSFSPAEAVPFTASRETRRRRLWLMAESGAVSVGEERKSKEKRPWPTQRASIECQSTAVDDRWVKGFRFLFHFRTFPNCFFDYSSAALHPPVSLRDPLLATGPTIDHFSEPNFEREKNNKVDQTKRPREGRDTGRRRRRGRRWRRRRRGGRGSTPSADESPPLANPWWCVFLFAPFDRGGGQSADSVLLLHFPAPLLHLQQNHQSKVMAQAERQAVKKTPARSAADRHWPLFLILSYCQFDEVAPEKTG